MIQHAVRIPRDLVDRLERLVDYVADSTEVGRIKPRVTRSDVIRHALDLGTEVLEHRAVMAAQARWVEETTGSSARRTGR